MMSIFSFFSSLTTFSTRDSVGPTQAPTLGINHRVDGGDGDLVLNLPASREMERICTMPVAISGTSISNRRLTSPGWMRLT